MGSAARLRLWWSGQSAEHRALHVVLGLGLAVYASLLVAQVAESYSHPDVRETVEPQHSLPYPITTLCLPEGVEPRAQLIGNDTARTPLRNFTYTSVIDNPGEFIKCFIFDLDLRVVKARLLSTSQGVVYHLDGGNASEPIFIGVSFRFTRPTGADAGGLLPRERGENAVDFNAVREAVNGNLRVPWSFGMSHVVLHSPRGDVTEERIEFVAKQVLVPRPTAEDPNPVGDIYTSYERLETRRLDQYVRNGVLYFLGAMGGGVSVVRVILFCFGAGPGRRARSLSSVHAAGVRQPMLGAE